jgi:hypothetical protein
MPCQAAAGRPRSEHDDGFAAADGLMALMVVAMLVALVLNATITGSRASRAAVDRRRAAAEAEYRLATEWPGLRGPGERRGASVGGGNWALVAKARGARDAGLCDVSSTVTEGPSRRGYRLETVRFCTSVDAP